MLIKKLTMIKSEIIFIDINECLFENCGSNSTCTNTPGSFTCTCNQGYSGDGKVCLGEMEHLASNMCPSS